jgi:hypothetical protein
MSEKNKAVTLEEGRLYGPAGVEPLMTALNKKRAKERVLFRDTPVLPPDKRINNSWPWEIEDQKKRGV